MNVSDGGRRRYEDNEHTLRIYPGTISEGTIYCPIPARKNSTAAEVIDSLINRLHLDKTKCYVLAEVKEFGGEEWILNPTDCPVQRMMLWPRMALENRLSGEDYRFLLREKNLDGSIHYGSLQSWLRITEERRRMMERGFLPQPQQKDFDDLCSLPDLNEKTLLENLRNRFKHEKIYTYVGSILIAINPFKFLPIYNPKYVKMYDNHQLGKLEPHIYAVADVAYHAMLQRKKNQCIVISGESGSGKTQSTNFLIHHLTALSQKGFASGVEQIILGAGPVLEAFGNAKTAHNNNSSRFGKFIQVNYQETGTVLGAYVEKYLLEKSRLVYQEHNERNYHVFYYLLAGASEEERLAFHLKQPEEYHYLNQDCFTVEGEDLRHDFERLQLAMEMAVTVRNSMAKSLYSALFDWIVFRINHALLNSKDLEHNTKTLSIGVLDIFGFEDYENNSFEQFCINFANERLQHYFNQHIFKLEQEEYRTEGHDDSTPCAILKSMDSFSFLQHPVHQRSLEILQRCKEEKYSITRKNPRTPLSDLQGMNTLNEKNQHDTFDIAWNVRTGIRQSRLPTSNTSLLDKDGIFANSASSKLLERAHGILTSFLLPPIKICQHLLEVNSLKHLTRLTLQDRITKSLLHLHKKKKPPSISAQFQASLSKLMETLGQAEPYFVKCIRSNAEKLPLRFSDALVLRQLRYTGMLETVRIRQSGYSSKYSFQDFVSHFHVLLPRNIIPSKFNIQDFFRKVNINPDHYQVGKTMVFLKEHERQHLQDLLHQEVLRRIILLQRWFRVLLCRQQFLHLRQASIIIQRFWRNYLNQKQIRNEAVEKDAFIMASAASILQASWRAHLERQRYLELRAAAVIIQQRWRELYRCRHRAATCIQARWKSYRQNKKYKEQRNKIILLQSTYRGFRARQRYKALKEQRLKETKLEHGLVHIKACGTLAIQGSDPSEWEDRSFDNRVKAIEEYKSVIESNRISRESSMDFSKESPDRSQSEERRWSTELMPEGLQSPQVTPESESSQGSLELLTCEESQKSKPESLGVDEGEVNISSPNRSTNPKLNSQDSAPSVSKPLKTSSQPDTNSSCTVLKKLEKLNTEKEKRQKELQQQNEKEMMEQIRQQTDILEKERKAFKTIEESLLAPSFYQSRQRIERPSSLYIQNTPKREHFRSAHSYGHRSDDPSRGGSSRAIFFTPKDNMIIPLVHSGNPQVHKQDEPAWKSKLAGPGQREVARPAHKKKARMARTRSDFLTRGTFADGEGDTEEDDYDDIIEPLLSLDQASHSELGPVSSLGQASHSDSEMTSQRFSSVDEQAKLHKAMSQEEITKLTVRQKSSDLDIRPQRAKMRFWAKGKQGEKKTTRVKPTPQSEVSSLFAGSDVISANPFSDELTQYHPTPPLSPELPGSCRKEFKENKEPSPKAKRRRGVKISSVALDSIHWQNDSVQIIASASDLKSMDEFLLKKMNDLDNEDSKKDTLVDVVFKKALKEFRQNIFSSYSSALAMDDGKSIRYKDLYALFEQILEKTMRLEQRDWNESPVRVWVNTFKVFLDEYMNEFKTLDSTGSKVPKTERKKRRKKETDLVEEHNGHIFKATQYSIPTYCEYCSSLIWIMDRASVCKLCKYACHKKCCLKTTAKCSKKYDPELSSRQFGVELSRLTSEDRAVPLVVEKLINYIEMHGLYTEGIYRKSGSTNKIKELRQGLDTDAENVNLDDYNIHVIASVFKQWLRDLPNPLMTFELYEEFLRAMGLQERKETIRGVYSVIDQLSRTHLNTLERLIFHLVRIALQEDTNRMSANALAIVFAPCILRCPDTTDPLQSVQDISKTTTCVELIVVEQMNKYKARLKDISSLEFAENKAKTRLSLIRRSMGKGRIHRGNYPSPSSPVKVQLPSMSDVPEETMTSEIAMETDITEQQQAAMQQEEKVLTEQIENLQKEKEELTFEMLVLEPRASDDETLESEASIGTADSSENLNMDSEERSSAISSLKVVAKSEPSSKLRKQLRKQPDSVDSGISSVSSCLSNTTSSHGTRKRFQIYSKSPFYRAASACEALGTEGPLGQAKSLEDRPQFISRGTFNPEKGKQKLKSVKNSPQKTKETQEGTVTSGRKKTVDPDCSSAQQLPLFGNNEFMV
ncbi:myosin-IXa-like protein [Cricetulus griseus]|uniref:Unconventional myosin-IXa n=1 Tax=Cricetulus griseus TaxID=10029 RepID=A0A061I2N0_CRIGR|nr:myosin-IXa-like protein [Cricetulus griseus]